MKIMGSHESLSEDLSNKYQCSRVSIASKNLEFSWFSDFGDRSRPPSLKGKPENPPSRGVTLGQ
jgi:hypothetical protein